MTTLALTAYDVHMLRVVDVTLALLALFGVAAAVSADWSRVWPKWRPFLAAVAIEQAVIAYSSWEANAQNAPGGARVVLLALSLTSLIASLVFVVLNHRPRRAYPRTSGRQGIRPAAGRRRKGETQWWR